MNKPFYIDVTLRDGGHQVNFDWDMSYVEDHFHTVAKIKNLTFIELGYWKQTSKSSKDFYHLNEEILKKLCNIEVECRFSIMVDYHYCSHNLEDYPKKEDFPKLDLIRICSRSQDVNEAVKFAAALKEYTGLKTSLNFFNITNYTEDMIIDAVNKGVRANADFIYFADTHGALDLLKEKEKYKNFLNIIRENGIHPGIHLHDHSGKAYLNYRIGLELGFESFDYSLLGMGKGVGNLKMEYVVDNDVSAYLMDLANKYEELLQMPNGVFGLITSNTSSTDYYSNEARKLGLKPTDLYKYLTEADALTRDVFDPDFLKKKTK